ncbi:hypothetical protein evm_004335 [Chilo suppressalis]|nr:hypothetical protein evm_004335 [Chilo suppressalis]
MAFKISVVFFSIFLIYAVQSENSDNNQNDTTTVKIEQQAVEEFTIAPPQPGEADPVIERSSHYRPADPKFHGFWKKKFVWRPRWVKTWKEKKIYVAVWKKMWGPTMLNEWVPIPKPPPGWLKYGPDHEYRAFYVKPHPH